MGTRGLEGDSAPKSNQSIKDVAERVEGLDIIADAQRNTSAVETWRDADSQKHSTLHR
jgi:hypothetical protein